MSPETTANSDNAEQTDNRPDEFEMVADAGTLAYAVYRRVDFDKVDYSRNFDDEFVSMIETATFTASVMSFHERLARNAEVRSIDAMDGDTRELVHKYDGPDGTATARRFLRTVRRNPAHVVLEMKHSHTNALAEGDD